MINKCEDGKTYTITLEELFKLRSPTERKKYNGIYLIDNKIEPVSHNVEAQSLIIFDLETETSYRVGLYLPENKSNLIRMVTDQGDTLLTFQPCHNKEHFHGRKIDNDEENNLKKQQREERRQKAREKEEERNQNKETLKRRG